MELFTEDEMARIEGYHRNDVALNHGQLSRLIEHARELMTERAFKGHMRPSRPEPRVFTNRIRESDFCTCTNDQAGQTEENMRREGFECVSSIPVVLGNFIHVHMHFRKP